jgi:hypothetical protein
MSTWRALAACALSTGAYNENYMPFIIKPVVKTESLFN